MLDVAEEHVDMLIAEGREVAETILMNFHFPWDTFSIERRPKVHIGQLYRASV